MRHRRPCGALAEHRQAEAEQQVLDHAQIPLHRLAAHGTVARDIADIQKLAVRKADGFQEPGEAVQVAHQPLHLHLFAHIHREVTLQRVERIRGAEHQRQHATLERRGEIEPIAQLRGHERMHGTDHGASGHQIDAAPPEFARTRTRQHEPPVLALFDQRMCRAQELRNSLYLVDDDHTPGRLSANYLEQALGPRPEALQRGGMEQIDAHRARVLTLCPCRLAGPTWTEEKKALGRRIEKSTYKRHIESRYGAIVSVLQPPRMQ